MVKKRIIFTLLYDRGNFVLSRNFRLQRVGNIGWLQQNYDFSKISRSIDELVVLDVSREDRNPEAFQRTLRELTRGCFVPIAAGGGIRSVAYARDLLRSGADKVVVNTAIFEKSSLVDDLAAEFGSQCVIASLDIRKLPQNRYQIAVENGKRALSTPVDEIILRISNGLSGEIYINSIDRDGTGHGYDLNILDMFPHNFEKPVIIAGGVGNWKHLYQGLMDKRVDGAATAHLFNFIGDGLISARQALVSTGIDIPRWDFSLFDYISNKFTLEPRN